MNPSNFKDLKVLVIHALRPTSRQTTIDHLKSFSEHMPGADVQYLHFQQPIPSGCESVSPDLVVVNYDFLNYRFTPLWPFVKNRHKDIARRAKKIVAIVQDDFWCNKLIDDWCIDWDVDRILTGIDKDVEIIYPRSSRNKDIKLCLNGYVSRIDEENVTPLIDRPIDLGQRVRSMSPHLGRFAQSKAIQAKTMAEAASRAGFVVDVSTRVEDSFIGESWLDFLKSCKFTVGMKGGASLYDPVGLLHTKVNSYLFRCPNATFQEIERRFFRGRDGKYVFSAVSPRLFESASAGTCQILQRDDYLGVLEPWRDYIPLEKDFSNIEEVVSSMGDLERCQEIANCAFQKLVKSRLFHYSTLPQTVASGLVGEHRSSSHGWEELKSYLQRASFIADSGELELHDAVIGWIYEIANSQTRYLERHGQPFLWASFRRELSKQRKGLTVSKLVTETVLNSVRSEVGLEVFEEIFRLSIKDKLVSKFVWVWRSVPKVI